MLHAIIHCILYSVVLLGSSAILPPKRNQEGVTVRGTKPSKMATIEIQDGRHSATHLVINGSSGRQTQDLLGLVSEPHFHLVIPLRQPARHVLLGKRHHCGWQIVVALHSGVRPHLTCVSNKCMVL